jgi:hypothetical protein
MFLYAYTYYTQYINALGRHRFRILVLIALMMEAMGISETSVNLYKTTQRSLPYDSHLLMSSDPLSCLSPFGGKFSLYFRC